VYLNFKPLPRPAEFSLRVLPELADFTDHFGTEQGRSRLLDSFNLRVKNAEKVLEEGKAN